MEVFALLGEWRDMDVGRGRRECGLLTRKDWSIMKSIPVLRKHTQTRSDVWSNICKPTLTGSCIIVCTFRFRKILFVAACLCLGVTPTDDATPLSLRSHQPPQLSIPMLKIGTCT